MNPILESWRELNGWGRASTILLILLAISFAVSWAPLEAIHGFEPAVPHYIATAIFLTLLVPLAWTAWKVQRGRKGIRVMAVMFFLRAFFSLLDGRVALGRGHVLSRSRTSIVLMRTLIVFTRGIGARRRANASTLNYPEQTGAVRG